MPDTPAPLFTAAELTTWIGHDVDEDTASLRERVVWGWLQPILGVEDRPTPVTEQLFSWAIELGAIAHENPSGKASSSYEGVTETFNERREEILAEVRASVNPAGSVAALPAGSFPPASEYPDPAVSTWSGLSWRSW
ncbi:hypothetical protein GCM10023340_38870 [Nocardioides marinquilinus]|uniref:Uncharacterized protein n=1 Tax=Nocardioides marinquilinus TaxID=1210400 RepID=A0ABP9PZM6_9ACTN